MHLKNKSLLITGGTGSFGNAFVDRVLELKQIPKRLIIFSRDELKQFEMEKKYQNHKNANILRFYLGDIRDRKGKKAFAM